MKKIIFGVILILTFLNNSYANYKKLAYDFSFNGIDGEEIKLSEYRNKVIIVVNVASRCDIHRNTKAFKIFGKIIKTKTLLLLVYLQIILDRSLVQILKLKTFVKQILV